ncbi:MAG: B12-binding domain-containing radical SAM protein [Deltaproteobacteria bacterium]|nr:MAG: B12-binding domain-containing radical SAM protein [Deltaproteobacteria bacterium]
MKTKKVLVINEPFVKDFCRTQRWAARTRGRALRAPDWLAYTTAVLEKEGVDVELYDFPAKDWGKDKLRVLVREKAPTLVVLDSTTPSIYSDIECAQICKEASPGVKIIMVGPHVTVCDGQTLREAGGKVDAVARGEYEYTVRDYAKCVLSGVEPGDVMGLTWLDGEAIIRNPDRLLIEDLDELPFPAWGHLDLWDYFDGSKYYPYIDVIGGRGCPFKCNFCLWPQTMHGNRYRLRSPENIVAEIKWVLEKWPKAIEGEFFFEDDTFTVNKKRAHAFCDLLIKSGIKCNWSVNSRADVVDEELFRHMKKAGCRLLLVGFESGSQKMLDKMRKGIKLEKMCRFIVAAKKAGLAIHGCFVLGLPGETRQTMQETLDFSLDHPLDTVQFSGAVPFPGTVYFENAREEGLLRAKRWDEWLNDGEQSAVVDYPGLTKKEVEDHVNKGLRQFYLRPGFLIKFLLETRSKQDLYRKLRGGRNFLNYLTGRG